MDRKPQAGPIYVAGAFRSNSGVGQGARLYSREMALNAKAHYRVDLTSATRMASEFPPYGNMLNVKDLEDMRGGTIVLHANPPQFQLALMSLPSSFLKTVHIRAYWAWELEELPPIWLQALPYIDSLECPSHFCRRAFANYTNIPVSVHAHAVKLPRNRKKEFCRDGIMRCLCIFDAGSSFERKNPIAVLQVFRKAFKEGEAELCFKISHADSDISEYNRFKKLCAQTPGVKIITDNLTEGELADLFLANDVYISLHRSEGYGLTVKEAINYGLYALATGWSGNVDFMTDEKCFMAPYRLVKKRWRTGPMAGVEARWAEVDVDATANILRNIKKELLSGEKSVGDL